MHFLTVKERSSGLEGKVVTPVIESFWCVSYYVFCKVTVQTYLAQVGTASSRTGLTYWPSVLLLSAFFSLLQWIRCLPPTPSVFKFVISYPLLPGNFSFQAKQSFGFLWMASPQGNVAVTTFALSKQYHWQMMLLLAEKGCLEWFLSNDSSTSMKPFRCRTGQAGEGREQREKPCSCLFATRRPTQTLLWWQGLSCWYFPPPCLFPLSSLYSIKPTEFAFKRCS